MMLDDPWQKSRAQFLQKKKRPTFTVAGEELTKDVEDFVFPGYMQTAENMLYWARICIVVAEERKRTCCHFRRLL